MDPTLVRQLCAASLRPGAFQQHSAVVLPLVRPDPAARVDQVARDYLALPPDQRPPGTIRILADRHGLDFHQLLRRLGELYQKSKFS